MKPTLDPPAEANTLEDTGLPQSVVLDLILKHAFVEGTITLRRLAEKTKLSSPLIHSMYRHFQREHLCDTRTMVGDDYEIALSNKGRGMAEVALKKNQYTGAAPVPLAEYSRVASEQRLNIRVTAASLRASLSDLVLPEHVIQELGAALVTGGTIFLYGSTGNGKTSLAERIDRVFDDPVYIPYAVEVSGQLLTVFDPLIHRAYDRQELRDPRWVLCRRPILKVGGELRVEMLEPRLDEVTRICVAPLQMKANNGLLLIDDFGRQHISPRELLNRWIVPLDRRTDVLNLWSGVSFEIPFELLVVFATNLPPSDLAEEAFLRRLKNKIKIEPMGDDLFKELLRRVFQEKGLMCGPEMAEYIRAECSKRSPDGLRACYPIDLATSICGIATFEQRPPTLDQGYVDRALNLYFAH